MLFEEMPLFIAGEGAYHSYRIPALLVTTAGTVLAFCEGRRDSLGDSGTIDLLVKRSIDGGRNFTDYQVIYHQEGVTSGNPAPICVRENGRIWLLFCKNN